MRDLVKRLEELSDRAEFDAGWYLKDLATGATANRRGDVPVPSASTRERCVCVLARPGKIARPRPSTRSAFGCFATSSADGPSSATRPSRTSSAAS